MHLQRNGNLRVDLVGVAELLLHVADPSGTDIGVGFECQAALFNQGEKRLVDEHEKQPRHDPVGAVDVRSYALLQEASHESHAWRDSAVHPSGLRGRGPRFFGCRGDRTPLVPQVHQVDQCEEPLACVSPLMLLAFGGILGRGDTCAREMSNKCLPNTSARSCSRGTCANGPARGAGPINFLGCQTLQQTVFSTTTP